MYVWLAAQNLILAFFKAFTHPSSTAIALVQVAGIPCFPTSPFNYQLLGSKGQSVLFTSKVPSTQMYQINVSWVTGQKNGLPASCLTPTNAFSTPPPEGSCQAEAWVCHSFAPNSPLTKLTHRFYLCLGLYPTAIHAYMRNDICTDYWSWPCL